MNYFYSTIRVESECPHSLEFDFQNKLTQIKQDPNFLSVSLAGVNLET